MFVKVLHVHREGINSNVQREIFRESFWAIGASGLERSSNRKLLFNLDRKLANIIKG